MSYKKTNILLSPKELVAKVITSESSQLLIPPSYLDKDPEVSIPSKEEKQVGLFSSGTTGQPKCIWNSYENLSKNGVYSLKAFDIKENERLLLMAKPWHVAGLCWSIMAEEANCEYKFITTKPDEGEKWLEEIQDFKPDVLLTVPPVLRALFDKDWFVPKVIFGGIPFKSSDFEPLSSHCDIMIQGYGQTEAGGLVASKTFNSEKNFEECDHLNCGKPMEGVKIETEGTASNPKEIFLKSETGYTLGFYKSGDVGYWESDEIHLVGRKESIINIKA